MGRAGEGVVGTVSLRKREDLSLDPERPHKSQAVHMVSPSTGGAEMRGTKQSSLNGQLRVQ